MLAGELDLAELVADHQLLDGRQRDGVRDGLDVEPVALVRGDAAGRRVGVRQETARLELREDAAHGRARDAQAVAIHQGLGPDGGCGRDIFLDDGPKDRLRAKVQGADGAVSTRQSGLPIVVSTL